MMELLAAVTSAAGVWLTARRRLVGWPVSLLATALYGWVFLQARLYADMALQGVFSLATLYGWEMWAQEVDRAAGTHARRWRPWRDMLRPFRRQAASPWQAANDNRPLPSPLPEEAALPTRPLPPGRALVEASGCLILSLLWIDALQHWSDDPTPWLDGGLSGASLLAQLWTARRHRTSWLLWAGIDVIYTGLFLTRELNITALLYGGYALLGLYGYRKWAR